MPAEKTSLSEKLERIKNTAKKLPGASATLNSATDQLGQSISELDLVPKRFNFGIPTWVPFEQRQSEYDGQHYE